MNKFMVQDLAEFVARASYQDLPEASRIELKKRILDSLGCAIGALNGEPVKLIRKLTEELGGKPLCTLIGGGKTSPDRAAFYNSALVRYLDFNDSYLAKGETCHPSDNLGGILSAGEYSNANGKDLLTALGLAYQIQCRLSEVAPVRQKGFDHTVQGSFACAAGVAKILKLGVEKIANAIAISGTALNALRVTRTGALSHWKGLAYPHIDFGATHAALLARQGITGPLEVFEGNKGFMDAIGGRFSLNWQEEGLDRVTRTIIKKYNAEIHSQSSIEGILELKAEAGFKPEEIKGIDIKIFDVAYNIIGGGEEGSKLDIKTKEEADHSLLYIVAVAILDGTVMPAQYNPKRIGKPDVQELLRKVSVTPNADYGRRFPDEMPTHLTVRLKDGRVLQKEKRDYEGFHTRPMPWEKVVDKFSGLSRSYTSKAQRDEIVQMVKDVEKVKIKDLMGVLKKVGGSPRRKK